MKRLNDLVPIILTHIGQNDFPYYIYDCIEQIRLFNKENDIILAINRDVKRLDYAKLAYYNCSVQYIEDLTITEKHRLFIKKTRLQKFWRVTMERFFILEEIMNDYRISKALHIENDNLIYFVLEDVFKIFEENYSGLSMPKDNDERCIAGIVFINDILILSELNSYFANCQKDRKYNEMQLLGQFFASQNLRSLPVISNNYFGKWKGLDGKRKYSNCVENFNGIFDAAAIGQFLGGKDKRSYKDIINGNFSQQSAVEIVPLVNEDAVYEYSNAVFEWEDCGNGLVRPICIENGEKSYIYNLHIHSKELFRFKSNAYDKR